LTAERKPACAFGPFGAHGLVDRANAKRPDESRPQRRRARFCFRPASNAPWSGGWIQRENCDLFGSIDRQAAHARTYTRQFLFADELSKLDKARDKRVSMRENSASGEREESRADRVVGRGYGFKTVLTYDQRGIRGRFDRPEGKSATMERPELEEHGKRGNTSPFLQMERVKAGKANWSSLSLFLPISRDTRTRNNTRIRGVKLPKRPVL